MSFAALEWAFELEVEGPQKAVLLALARHADDAGRCYPAVPRLCRLAGVRERAARMAIARLEGCGALTVSRSTGGRKSSDYVLNLNYTVKQSPSEPPAGVHAVHPKGRPNGAAGVHVVHPKGLEVHEMHPKDPPEVHEMHPKPQPAVHEMPLSPVRGARDAPPAVHDMHPNLHGNLSKGRKGSESARGAPRTPVPEDWQPNAEQEGYAIGLGFDPACLARRFVLWHRRKRTLSPDWAAEWEWWCDNEVRLSADREAREDSRGNGMVKVIAQEGWVSARRNGHDREADAGAKVIQGIFGHA
jgi:hypothetical protein